MTPPPSAEPPLQPPSQAGQPLVTRAHPFARAVVGAFVFLLAALPDAALVALGNGVGALAFALGIRRKVALDNLRRCFPDKTLAWQRKVARGAYANMALTALESLVSLHRDFDRHVVAPADTLALLERARAEGKGVLIGTGHFGNWEVFWSVLSRRGLRFGVITKPLKGAVNALIVKARLNARVRCILPKGAVAATLESLRDGYTVAMLIDQVIAADKGLFVPFFDQPASTTPALGIVAKKSGAPVFVGVGVREGRTIRLSLEGPIPWPEGGTDAEQLQRHTAQVTAALEALIRRHPEQWLWLHRRFKVRPPSA